MVIDGLDEASRWELTEAYLPSHPDRIRIVLSAREKPNDSAGAAWLRQLGLPRGCLRQLGLLDRAGLADVLREMGFPLDRLSEQVEAVALAPCNSDKLRPENGHAYRKEEERRETAP